MLVNPYVCLIEESLCNRIRLGILPKNLLKALCCVPSICHQWKGKL